MHQLAKLKYKKIANQNYQILEDFNFEIGAQEYTIPKGFITDFASVPKILQNWIKKEGKNRLAATIHDYFYKTKKLSKLKADLIFLDLLKHEKLGFIKRNLMFLAVLLFGFFAYAKK